MKTRIVGALILLVGLTVTTAHADPATKEGFRGWGPRVGLTSGPDQFHFGGHMDIGNFAEHVRIQPSLDIGFGDNATLFAINLDGQYRFASQWDVWTPYVGGGPGIYIISVDVGDESISNTDTGLSAVGGIEKGLSNGSRFFLEARLGLFDAPDFKATAGWTFFH